MPPEQVGRTKHNTENSFGSVTSVVIMADGSTRLSSTSGDVTVRNHPCTKCDKAGLVYNL